MGLKRESFNADEEPVDSEIDAAGEPEDRVDAADSLGISRWTLPAGVALCIFAMVYECVRSENATTLIPVWASLLLGGSLGVHGAVSLSINKRGVLLDGPSIFAGFAAAFVLFGFMTLGVGAIFLFRFGLYTY